MSEYVIITGMSGAGRTEVSRNLEDLGWFVIDNLPPSLMPKVGELAGAPGSSIDKVALAVGTGRYDREIVPALAALRAHGDRVRVTTRRGSAEAVVEVSATMRAGHVSLPNGTGVGGMGVSPSELTSGGDRDPIAGTPWHKHVPARIERVA